MTRHDMTTRNSSHRDSTATTIEVHRSEPLSVVTTCAHSSTNSLPSSSAKHLATHTRLKPLSLSLSLSLALSLSLSLSFSYCSLSPSTPGVHRLPHAAEPGEGGQDQARPRFPADRRLPGRHRESRRLQPVRARRRRHRVRQEHPGRSACWRPGPDQTVGKPLPAVRFAGFGIATVRFRYCNPGFFYRAVKSRFGVSRRGCGVTVTKNRTAPSPWLRTMRNANRS